MFRINDDDDDDDDDEMFNGQGTTWRRNIAENFNRLSRVHERYRQTTDGR